MPDIERTTNAYNLAVFTVHVVYGTGPSNHEHNFNEDNQC